MNYPGLKLHAFLHYSEIYHSVDHAAGNVTFPILGTRSNMDHT